MLDHDDHRAAGPRLGLFHLQDEAPGMVFWHPKGLALVRALEDAVRRRAAAEGYHEVRTPQLLRQSLWEASGHWEHFRHGMFALEQDGVCAALKPVSCPCHIQIAQRRSLSYRDLPLRLCEFGLCHRDEPSGTLHGLFRLRQFTQDDGHIFCAEDQVAAEIDRFCRGAAAFYAAMGFVDVAVALSTRPPQRAGDDATWDRAEAMLAAAAAAAGLRPALQPGEGAFYGPKLEFTLRDRLGRAWQCGTIQLDLVLPRRFGLHYVDAGDVRRHPAMLHRALLGSVERFLAVLLEHGALPPWLAPVQVVVVPVHPAQAAAAAAALAELRAAGLRAELDDRPETLARRVAEAHAGGVPCLAVVGAREAEAGTLALRERGEQSLLPRAEAVAALARRCAPPL
jgi:threonyl-tRNA synthetase